jgi:CspA family cold shock protein
METGRIKKLVRDRGFGFIRATDGREIFFHRTGLLNADFDNLSEEQEVEFEIEDTPKGLRATNVQLTE